MCTVQHLYPATSPFTHSPISTNAHVLGGTSAVRKSKHPQPQFHIIEYVTKIDLVPDLLTSFSVPQRPANRPVPDKPRPQRRQPVQHGPPRLRRRHGGFKVFDMVSIANVQEIHC